MTESAIEWYATPAPRAPQFDPADGGYLAALAGQPRYGQGDVSRAVRIIAFVTSFTVLGGLALGGAAVVLRGLRRALLRCGMRNGEWALAGILSGVVAVLLAEVLIAAG